MSQSAKNKLTLIIIVTKRLRETWIEVSWGSDIWLVLFSIHIQDLDQGRSCYSSLEFGIHLREMALLF